MNPSTIRTLVIVGGGTAGWMAAAAAARYLQHKTINIVLVESEEVATVGVGEASVPMLKTFNTMLGIDEWEFVKQVSGSFKLGIEFRDWHQIGSRYFHAFGDFGADIEGIAPHHFWLRMRAQGEPVSLAEFSFPTQAARKNHFAPPPKQADLSAAAYSYAYHFDASLYAQFLRRYAEARGVKRVVGHVESAHIEPQKGFITRLELASGEKIQGDFFIDCSGFKALLIKEALSVDFVDWRQWLTCDSALVAPCLRRAELTPYTVSSARAGGWQWRIPLQHRVGNGYVYASEFISAEAVHATLIDTLESAPLSEPRTLKFTAGHRQEFWKKNCLALGLSAGFLEPLESTSIQLIQTGLMRFLECFPRVQINETAIAEYNRITANEYARIRDFLILHYCTTQRSDSELWRYCQSMPLPESLQHKIDVFTHTGRVPMSTEESYSEASWVAIFTGQEVFPKHYASQADFIAADSLRAGMNKRRDHIARLVATMPSHEEFIKRVCQSDIR